MRQRGRRVAQGHRADVHRMFDARCRRGEPDQCSRSMGGAGTRTSTRLAAVRVRVTPLFVVGRFRQLRMGSWHALCLMTRWRGRCRVVRMAVRGRRRRMSVIGPMEHLGAGERGAGPVDYQAQGEQQAEQGGWGAHGGKYNLRALNVGHVPVYAGGAPQ